MMIIGFAGLGFMAYRRKNSNCTLRLIATIGRGRFYLGLWAGAGAGASNHWLLRSVILQ